jgi:hypothetical protein
LWQDTDVSEEYTASIFRVEVCRFRNAPNYTGKLQEKYSWYPRRGNKKETQSKLMGRNE